MDITNHDSAESFLAAWGAQSRPGIIAAAIDGCMRSFRIMAADRSRYGVDATADMREAVSVLKMGYRREFGVEYGA